MTTSLRPGFRGFRRPEEITSESLAATLERIDTRDLYVVYTGGKYGARRASLRSRSLATVTEVFTPVPLRTLLERAARAEGPTVGFDPSVVRGGLSLHQGAKPAVYLFVEKRGDDYVAVRDIPTPDAKVNGGKAIKAGDVIAFPSATPAPATVALPAPDATASAPSKGKGKAKKASK